MNEEIRKAKNLLHYKKLPDADLKAILAVANEITTATSKLLNLNNPGTEIRSLANFGAHFEAATAKGRSEKEDNPTHFDPATEASFKNFELMNHDLVDDDGMSLSDLL